MKIFVSQLVKLMIHCRHVQSHLRLGVFLLRLASRSREMHQYLLHHLSNVTEIRTRIANLNDHKIAMSRKLQSATRFAVKLKLYADPLRSERTFLCKRTLKSVEILRFTLTTNGRRKFVPRDQVSPLFSVSLHSLLLLHKSKVK